MSADEFKRMYLPYHQKLYRIACRLLDNISDAEDIIQEAYIKLWNKREDLHYVDNRESYCVILVRNMCLDFLRTDKSRLFQSESQVSIPDVGDTTGRIDDRDDMEYVKTLINSLPEQQKTVMILKHFDGYSNEEIEEMTGLSSVNVRVLLSRGRKKVKEIFEKKCQRN